VIRVLALPKYDLLGASSRLRFIQYITWLRSAGFHVEQHSLLSDKLLQSLYEVGHYSTIQLVKSYVFRLLVLCKRGRFDVLWIEKEALPWFPLWAERLLLSKIPYVLDYDDAVFHDYDEHRFKWVRKFYGRRLDGLMANAKLVVGGNRYLIKRAIDAGAPWVELLPTVIDLNRYPLAPIRKSKESDGLPRIVWIGSFSTVKYLALLAEPLQKLSLKVPFILRVIGGKIEIPGVQVEFVTWEEASEVQSIASADIGVMPLSDSNWEKGKCGYKLIQYMACSLPVVTSPIGVNVEIVQNGINGFLADKSTDWVLALEQLLIDPILAIEMGKEGRRRVENNFCLQVSAPKLEVFFRSIFKNSSDGNLK
jgi:glycosyltransferase involved in cell wall biosynthesis